MFQCVTVKAPRQIIDVGVVRNDGDGSSPAPIHPVSDRKHAAGEYKLILMKIEVLYTALLDLESDKLKLNALPTGAPLREQVLYFHNCKDKVSLTLISRLEMMK